MPAQDIEPPVGGARRNLVLAVAGEVVDCPYAEDRSSQYGLPRLRAGGAAKAVGALGTRTGAVVLGCCQVKILLGPETNNRFAWEVISPDAAPTDTVPNPVFRVVVDVEGGALYTIETVKPMESHGEPL